MTVSQRPSAGTGEKTEPVIIPSSGLRLVHTARKAPVRPPEDDGRRPGLGPTLVERMPGTRRLRPAKTPMTPRQVFADPDLIPVFLLSLILHLALLTLAILLAAHHRPRGNPQAPETGAVDMMFVTPPAQSGMKGERSPDQAGGTDSPKSSQSSNATPEKSEESEGAVKPTTDKPAAPPVPEAPSDEKYPEPTNETAPVNPASSNTGQGSRKTTKQSTSHQSVSHEQHRQRAPSPFDSPMDLSFDQSSAPRRSRRHGRSGGSGGPIDLSIGPMIQNGQLNAPFATRSSTRGVSDDYSAEVDRWIRHHMYYPEEAARNGEEGPSSVHVVIDRQGRVRFVRLTNQSGSYQLDASTTGMFQGAQLPPVPPDIAGDHFDLDVTINYILIRH